jgi:hypothetical protein
VKSMLPAGSTQVNLPQMAAGMYVARMQDGDVPVITRFIVK